MGKRREMTRRCGQICDLIEENQYTTALEQMDELPLEDVESIEDLYLFAEVYEKAERMDMTKKIYYLIYERTHAKHILYRLLRLVIRLGDMEEARELFLAYEVVAGVTLDTFELRYRLAKAEGEPRTKLIEILEDLKREEYTEEWGYQLALLYEMEGLREKCIQECKDLKLWFGEGVIVDKAAALQEKCEADDWAPPKDDVIPEPEEPDIQEEFYYAAPPVDVTELEETAEPEETTEPEEMPEPEQMPEPEEEPVTESELAVEEAVLEPAIELEPITKSETEPEKLEPVQPVEEPIQLEVEKAVKKPLPLNAQGVSEPVVIGRRTPLVPPRRKNVESLDALLEEDAEDVSEHGIHYHTLKRTIHKVKHSDGVAHFVFAGGEERITLAVAKRVIKELNHVGYSSARSIVKITAEKLNEIELSEQIEKLLGGCMLVTDAPELNQKVTEELIQLIMENEDRIVVMLAGPFDEMDCFLSIYPELSKKMRYKVRM